jgi:SnoaL-like domain
VRSIVASWERGDFGSIEWAHPEIEFVIADGVSPGQWSGRAGMVEGWRDFLSAWDGWRSEAQSYRELDDGRVLVLSRFAGRGRTSGLELEHVQATGAALYQVRHGKVIRIVLYMDAERALVELGLAAEAGSPGS